MEVAPPLAALHAWEEEDQALMELLMGVEGVSGSSAGLPLDQIMADADADADAEAPPSPSSSVGSGSASSRRKLTPAERRARHREVVRRSYHRNKVR